MATSTATTQSLFSGLSEQMAGTLLRNISHSNGSFTPPMDMRRRVRDLDSLPMLPDTGRRLLELSADESATAHDLALLVERDPSLAAQMMRWARSPLYGYRGEINSVEDAVVRVLGFDRVLNIALGLVALESLNVPVDGPCGLRNYWRHAIYTASLVGKLEQKLDPVERAPQGLAYLTGLLHNVGFLLLGHLFPQEFRYLNRLIIANPDTPVVRLERFAFGVDHCELGCALAEAWELPEAVSVVLVEHHNPYYRGEHQNLVRLVSIADSLLAGQGFGDVHDPGLPLDILDELGLDATILDSVMQVIEENAGEMDSFASQISS
ncbi:MAG TPA: HDOD domain-containing protein [Chromatiaceae bacterium]|jgi:HD-like signal output (HDOD) protein|nr:HDOD domain-containing protein [Chromatiaceae bacterium]HIA08965.1 HDOD domain-containing protein [Chromatiaceae bacterium]HIN83184.1 HDOD domain-containing protein [Chromatiales bacterium]HIO53605.1 HDOD domain-containing protein [Chromatiales bacterium]